MSKIKLLLIFSVLFSAILSTSCSKDDDKINEKPGEIAGLGEFAGELQGGKFNLPSGITLVSEITGVSSSVLYGASDFASVPSSKKVDLSNEISQSSVLANSYDVLVGSGKWVLVRIPLKNTTNASKEVIFPARLIVKAKSSTHQNGILLKQVKVAIPANKEYNIWLQMYCGNEHRGPSSAFASYEWGVISNSPLLKELTDILADKKINIEEFSSSSSIYENQRDRIQSILWRITDGSGMEQKDIDWLRALPKSGSK